MAIRICRHTVRHAGVRRDLSASRDGVGTRQEPVTGQLDENFTSSVSLALTVKLSAPLGI